MRAPDAGHHDPIRTCIGCRARAERHQLLRLALVAPHEPAAPAVVVPDERARRPGRGAWIHPLLECLDLAERRKAVTRAFRVTGPVDTGAVRALLAGADAEPNPASAGSHGKQVEKR